MTRQTPIDRRLGAGALFARFMEHLPGLAWIKDPQGRYVFANEAAARAFGLPPEELYGRSDAELFPPETARQFAENDEKARAEGSVQVTEVLEHGDGVLHHSLVTKFAIPSESGVFVAGMAVDITDRIQAEQALEQSEERLLMALSSARMAAWSWSAEERLVVSENAADILGGPALAAALGPNPEEYSPIHPEDVGTMRETVTRAIEQEGDFVTRVRLTLPSHSTPLLIESRGKAVRDARGAPRLYGVVSDVSERVRAEALLLAQRHVLELVARDTPADQCLAVLCRSVEQIDARVRMAVLLASADRSRFEKAVAPGIPGFAAVAVALAPGEGVAGACAALLGGGAVACPDIEHDARWPEPWRALCREHGLRAGCAVPIAESEGVAGAVLLGFGEPAAPTEWELSLAEMAASMAGIVLRREHTEQALRQSEERYRSLTQATTSIVWTTDPTGAFVAPQPSWAAYTGQTPKAMLGFGWAEAIHPEDRDAVLALWETARQARAPYRSQGRLWHAASQSYRHFEARAIPILDAAGEPREWVGTCTDVEDRERGARALRESEQHFRTTANTAPTVLFLTEPDGNCSFLSSGWTEFSGQGEAQALGRGWVEAVHPDDREPAIEIFRRANERHEAFSLDCRIRSVDGEYRWVTSAGRPRFSATGEYRGQVGAMNDVHERKQAEEALREADRRKDEFLATIAHELRNPLAPLVNSLELLRMGALDGRETERAHDTMDRQIQQMVRLIDDLLDVSRISRGKIALREEWVDLADVLRLAMEISRPALDAAGLEIEVQEPAAPVALRADPTRLGQVFANLLNNAAKFSERGGRVTVAVEQRGDEVHIAVRDHGVGIPTPMLERVFDLFTQVDTSLEKEQGGLGIGLTLVKRLVELHGGQVEARSEGPGRGSEFVVRLPVAGARAGAETAAPAPPRATAHSRGGARRVLVVDDNGEHTESLALWLQRLGHETRTAGDGVEALEVAEAFRPDVVLLDIGMPRMNGYEAARRLRERPWAAGTLLVAVSGWGQEADKQRSREAGFDRHLVKPLAAGELEDVLGE